MPQNHRARFACGRGNLSSANSLGVTNHLQYIAGPYRQTAFEFPVYGDTGESEASAPRRLRVHGIGESSQIHFLKDSSDPLAQFLSKPEISAHPGNSRVPGKAGDVPRRMQINETGETSRTLNFDAVVKNLNSDVITTDVVRPVYDRVHQTFQPGVFGDERDSLKSPATDEGPSSRHKVEYRLTGKTDLHWDRTFDPDVVEQFLACARTTLGSPVTQHPYVCLW